MANPGGGPSDKTEPAHEAQGEEQRAEEINVNVKDGGEVGQGGLDEGSRSNGSG